MVVLDSIFPIVLSNVWDHLEGVVIEGRGLSRYLFGMGLPGKGVRLTAIPCL